MSVGDARNGRRDNGLQAAAYVAAGDVDPRVGEHLLDVLALAGIAAYLRPSSDLNPITRASTLPRRPTDRLFVDREHVGTAKDHLARLAREEREVDAATRTDPEAGRTGGADRDRPDQPAGGFAEPTSDEVDKAFAAIVAGFGEPWPPTGHTAGPDTGPTAAPSAEQRAEPHGGPQTAPQTEARSEVGQRPADQYREQPPEDEPTLLDGLDTFGADLPDDEAERFVPPEAPPVPRPSLTTTLAVVGVVGGLVLFLKPGLLSFLSESLAMFLGFTAVVAGFGTLVWRLRPGDDDAGPDDGARV